MKSYENLDLDSLLRKIGGLASRMRINVDEPLAYEPLDLDGLLRNMGNLGVAAVKTLPAVTTALDFAMNFELPIASSEIDPLFRKIYIQSGTPSPVDTNDLWIDTS